MKWNWLSDEAPRVLRAVREFVDEVREDTAEAVAKVWKRIKKALDGALMPYPEARVVVLRALEEEFVPAPTG
jgi:hypothetical protein